jgi:hypothetical protein
MGNPFASLLTTLLLLVSPLCYGQIHTVVSHPVLEVNEQEVHIFYDIINSSPNDRFNISVLITYTPENAWSRGLNYNNSYINRSSDRKGNGACHKKH